MTPVVVAGGGGRLTLLVSCSLSDSVTLSATWVVFDKGLFRKFRFLK